jgi:glycosyltransferase involved in cell wall biosynthesis
VVSFSVLIITHGRKELLMKCLQSLKILEGEWQLILLSNGEALSTEILECAAKLTPNFTPLQSTEYLSPGAARNLAFKSVQGEWVYLIDDDAYLTDHYWKIIKPFLSDERLDVIGGPDSPAEGMGYLATALAITLSSPFCTGATFSRHQSLGKKLIQADEEKLTSCNLWVRMGSLGEVRFPEDYQRAEENYFLQRLGQVGARMFYHPKLTVCHYRRTKLSKLLRPSFLAGYYRSKLIREKFTTGNEAFWLPSLFVFLHFLFFFEPITFWSLVKLYTGIILSVSLGLSARAGKIYLFPAVAFLHYFIVFLYGLGFIAERVRGLWK